MFRTACIARVGRVWVKFLLMGDIWGKTQRPLYATSAIVVALARPGIHDQPRVRPKMGAQGSDLFEQRVLPARTFAMETMPEPISIGSERDPRDRLTLFPSGCLRPVLGRLRPSSARLGANLGWFRPELSGIGQNSGGFDRIWERGPPNSVSTKLPSSRRPQAAPVALPPGGGATSPTDLRSAGGRSAGTRPRGQGRRKGKSVERVRPAAKRGGSATGARRRQGRPSTRAQWPRSEG